MQSNNVLAFKNNSAQRNATGCEGCVRRASCPLNLANNDELEGSGARIVHLGPLHQGEHAIRVGDKFDGVYVVRSGTFKSFDVNSEGEAQITGFHLPGEILGMEGWQNGFHTSNVVSLDTGSLCRVPMEHFAEFSPGRYSLMLYLLKVMDGALSRSNRLHFSMSKHTATQRLVEFLVDLFVRSQRHPMQGRRMQGHRLVLHMSRGDIANYIGLAIETVSRVFSQLDAIGVLDVKRRSIELKDMGVLQDIVRGDSVAGALLKKAG